MLLVLALAGTGTVVTAQPGQTEFKPVTEVPASEQLPAPRLVIAAYSFAWIAVLAYLWLMWRRLNKVEQEISTLSVQLAKKRP
jgi:CcmD family protein